jgi:hypothetical protein
MKGDKNRRKRLLDEGKSLKKGVGYAVINNVLRLEKQTGHEGIID